MLDHEPQQSATLMQYKHLYCRGPSEGQTENSRQALRSDRAHTRDTRAQV